MHSYSLWGKCKMGHGLGGYNVHSHSLGDNCKKEYSLGW